MIRAILAPMLTPIARYPARHWRGHAGLWLSCLGAGLGLRLALGPLLALRPLGWPATAVAALSLASLALLVWQLGGGLRAVARAGRDPLASFAGLAACLATAMLFLESEADTWAARARPAPPPPPAGAQPLPVARGIARLEGDITWPAYARLVATLAAEPAPRVLALASPGGSIPAARAMARRISEAGVETRAAGLCASACTLVFMGGHRRSLAPQGALGFHAYASLRNDPLVPPGPEEARDRAWLAARGVSPAFLAQAYAVPHATLWRPTQDELRAAGVLKD